MNSISFFRKTVLWQGMVFFLSILIGPLTTEAQESPGLQVGIKAPDFTAMNYQGKSVRLSDYYKEGPVVLIFYRGGWCYYCNLQLQAYQKKLKSFEKLKASIIAISVDRQHKAAETVKQKELGFEIISNPQANLLELYNAVYQVPEELAKTYKKEYRIDLQEASGRDDRIIAVPATYVIDQAGYVVFAHSDIDYKIRKSPKEILRVIKNISQRR